MRIPPIILLLPLSYAKIKISVLTNEKTNELEIDYSGSDVDTISDKERVTFQLTDEELKRAVASHFGLEPDDAFVKDPTTWGDTYITYGWKPVVRYLAPYKAKILSIASIPTAVLTQVFNNTSGKKAKFTTRIRQDVDNTLFSIWHKRGELTVNDDIEYTFKLAAPKSMGKLRFSYDGEWGDDVKKSETVTVGSDSIVEVSLSPQQTVVAELIGTRQVMKLQVQYMASLSGSVVVNYAETYKGHHFWSLDVNSVMDAGGLSKSVKSYEVIIVDFFSNSKVVVRDAITNELLDSINLKVFNSNDENMLV